MDKARSYVVVSDVEGVEVNTAADFAWMSRNNLLSPRTKAIFSKEVCEFYDTNYDDGRYLFELSTRKRKKYSTGKWPLLSLCLMAYDGIDDRKLIEYAKMTTQENPGAYELLRYLMEKTDGEVYFATSSYPAVPLIISHRAKPRIPSSHVFCLGSQLGASLKAYDENPNFEEEVRVRSPLSCLLNLSEYSLAKFLHSYLYICERLGKAYENKDVEQIQFLLEEHDKVFDRVVGPPLSGAMLRRMLLDEEGCMGSHRKVEIMKSVAKNRKTIYIGDGIVDAMPIKFADYGISLNMTNTHALSFSKLNVTTTNVSSLIPIFDSILSNRFNPKKLKKELCSDEIKIFTQRDIRERQKEVVKINKGMKTKLKELFKPVSLV